MRAYEDVVDPVMVALRTALCNDTFDSISFIFYNSDDDPLCELVITELTIENNYIYFIGEDDTGTVMGEITESGIASYFLIKNFNGDTCFEGSVGESGDAGADIKFNDRSWTAGDMITLSELKIRFDMGEVTLIA